MYKINVTNARIVSLNEFRRKNNNTNEPVLINKKIPTSRVKHYGYKIRPVEEKSDIIPMSFFDFCIENFKQEFSRKRYGFRNDPYESVIDSDDAYRIRKLRKSLKALRLNDKNIWKREQMREHVECPRILLMMYYSLCFILDIIFKDKPIDRFWFLETVARMPYFSYVAILHMYETLGWWELDSDLKREHYLQEENEVRHLKIMESLGGNSNWWNRFIARHGAMAYYGILLIFFMTSPRLAYLSSELLEMHAVDTYTEFYESNASILKNLPLTTEAMKYKPDAWNLYEVFKQIADDEYRHAINMKYIQQLPDKKVFNDVEIVNDEESYVLLSSGDDQLNSKRFEENKKKLMSKLLNTNKI
jgi:ubiquinol oxidase